MGGNTDFRKNNDKEYRRVHKWVWKNKPDTGRSEQCNRRRKLMACNLTGGYLYELQDWAYMCSACHSKYDQKKFHTRSNPKRNALIQYLLTYLKHCKENKDG